MNKNRSGVFGGILVGVAIIIGLIVWFTGMSKVPAGYVGVQYKMNGGIVDKTLPQG